MIVCVLAAVANTHCLTVQCNFQNTAWVQIGTQYTCRNPIINADGNLTHVLKVTGTHMSRRNNSDVKAFHASGYLPQLYRIPLSIEDFFPNLLHFGWQSGNITTVSSFDFRPFPDLESISVQQNKLVSLDGSLFSFNERKLRHIDFSNNLLEVVGNSLLSNVNNLTSARFIGNKCVNMTAATRAEIQTLIYWFSLACPRPATTTRPSFVVPTYTVPVTLPNSGCSGTCLSTAAKVMIGIASLFLSLLLCLCRYFCRCSK